MKKRELVIKRRRLPPAKAPPREKARHNGGAESHPSEAASAEDTSKEGQEGGWTFIETLIVIGIVMILTSSVGFMAVKYLDRARVVTAKSQIETLCIALDAYFLDCGQYPSDTQGLSALWEKPYTGSVPSGWNGPYVSKPIPRDPWGNDYEYAIPGYHDMRYSIRSLGRDGREGGEGNDADVTSWD